MMERQKGISRMTTDTTSNPQGGLDWEDICLDPHHFSSEEGRAQGRQAGALAGFREGRALGQTKALEFGVEVGFYCGVVAALKGSNSWEDNASNRVKKSLAQLQKALDDFPSSDQIFSSNRNSDDILYSTNSQIPHEANKSDLENHSDDENPTKLDILHEMQRIRARFKLLMVQLGNPQFSLKQVFDDSQKMHSAQAGAVENEDQEW